MDVTGDHLLASTGFSGDQYGRVGTSDLLRTPQGRQHFRIAYDRCVRLARGCKQYCRNQIGVGGQRQELACTVTHRLPGYFSRDYRAARDHGHDDTLGRKRRYKTLYATGYLTKHKIVHSLLAQAR